MNVFNGCPRIKPHIAAYIIPRRMVLLVKDREGQTEHPVQGKLFINLKFPEIRTMAVRKHYKMAWIIGIKIEGY